MGDSPIHIEKSFRSVMFLRLFFSFCQKHIHCAICCLWAEIPDMGNSFWAENLEDKEILTKFAAAMNRISLE